MADRIVRAISTDGMVQAAAICSRDLTERARQIHKTLPVATAALGRALAHPFDVLVLDEALTGLDDETRARCLAVIDRAAGARTLVMATHDPAEAQALRARPAAVT